MQNTYSAGSLQNIAFVVYMMKTSGIEIGLSYNDVLLVPRRSAIASRGAISTESRLMRGITIKIPIITANMDTVTESGMAIAIAREGGLGVIHRFMDIEREASEVARVKRAEAYMIDKPYSISATSSIGDAREMMSMHGVSGLLVVDKSNRLMGIISDRDIRFAEDEKAAASTAMTKRSRLIVGKPGISIAEAVRTLDSHRLEKLPIVDSSNKVVGLITSKDIYKHTKSSISAKDSKGRLLVGAAIGIKGDYIERATALCDAGADLLVLDVAHGHTDSVISAIKAVKREIGGVKLIAGNVATAEGVDDLAAAGADCVKVGIGPGAACTTRRVTGAGMPQFTAIVNCYDAAVRKGISIIADGGIKDSGDITKSLAAGASAVMAGSLFAGTEESPGYFVSRRGVKYKAYRGMASLGANISRKKLDKMDIDPEEITQIVPEGVESSVPYRGTVKEVVSQLVGGIRSGMSYCGASNLDQLRKNAKFIRLTESSQKESYEKLEQY